MKEISITKNWVPPNGLKITHASINQWQIVISTSQGYLYYFETEKLHFDPKVKKFSNEISCLDITPFQTKSEVIAIGFWKTNSVVLTNLKMEEITTIKGDLHVPRSILMKEFEGLNYLLIASGNGILTTYKYTNGISDKKTITLGTQPLSLYSDDDLVYASSDRPTIIHSKSQKLMYSNLNLSKVSHTIALKTSGKEGMLFLNENQIFGKIEKVQKLHVKTYKFNETVRRIVYHQQSSQFCILTNSVDKIEVGFVKVVQNFKIVSSFRLDEYELGSSIHSMVINDIEYILVGTGYAFKNEDEPQKGRLLLFTLEPFELISSFPLQGCCYSIVNINQSPVIAVNSKVIKLNLIDNKFETECIHHGHVLALTLAVVQDYILVADLMKSVTCLYYDVIDKNFTERSRDYETNWMTALESIDENTYIGSDNSHNLLFLRKNSEKRMESLGGFHLSELVNRFRKGF
jgi:DNA damage-binding protein 1